MTDFEVTEEMVMALADGELEPDKEEAVRAAIKQDPTLQKLYEDMILTRDALIQTYGNLAEDDTYKELVAQIKREGAETRDLPPKSENVIWINFKKLNLGVPELSRIAASLAVGLFAGGIFSNAYFFQTADVSPEIMRDNNSQKTMLRMRGASNSRETSSDESSVVYQARRLEVEDIESRYKRSIKMEKGPLVETLSIEPWDSAPDLNNLAGLYKEQGRYSDAEPLYKRSLAILEKALGPDHREVATTLNHLAYIYEEQGRYSDAEALLKRSLAILEKALGPDHREVVATTLNHLAYIYEEQGRYSDAEALLNRSLAILEKARGPAHTVLKTLSEKCSNYECFLNDLGVKFEKDGKTLTAKSLYEAAIQVNPKAPAPYAGLGDIYYAMKNFKKAAQNFEVFLNLANKKENSYSDKLINKYREKLKFSKK